MTTVTKSAVTSVTLDGNEFKATNYVGESVALVPVEFRPGIPTKHGKKDAFKTNVMILSGDHAGYFYDEALIFNSALVSQLTKAEKQDDATIIGVLETRESNNQDENGDPFVYVVVADPSDTDIRLAARYGV